MLLASQSSTPGPLRRSPRSLSALVPTTLGTSFPSAIGELLRGTPLLAHLLLAAFSVLSLGHLQTAQAQDPALHQRIDQLFAAQWHNAQTPLANDEEFIRRIYLDLIGQIPPVDQVRAFLADTDPDKRTQLVDRLLDDPRHARHLATWFDVTAMERRAKIHIEQADWRKFLVDSFTADKPLDQLAIELLAADGTEERGRVAAKFLLDREVDGHLLTRDVGRVFLGVDLQCAQCHDHPQIDSYYQADYYGIYAAFLRSAPIKLGEVTFVSEKADGGFEFTSAFTGDSGQAEMRLPDGWPILDQPVPTDAPYLVAPADNVRPIPRWSRRAAFAEAMVHSNDRMFARNWANRLWALMLGRGIVHPLDLHHADNPPSHPELLETLTAGLIEHNYHVRPLLREIALSRAYQRPFDLEQVLLADALAAPQSLADAETLAALEEQELASRSQRDFARRELIAANQSRLEQVGALLAARQRAESLATQIETQNQALQAAQAQQAHWQSIVEPLQRAASDLNVAAEELPLALFMTRLTTATEQVNATTAALETSRTELQTAQQAIPPLEAPAAQAETALAAAQTQFDRAWNLWSDIRTRRLELASKSKVLHETAERQALAQQVRQLREPLEQGAQKLSVLEQQAQMQQMMESAAQAKLAEVERAWSEHQAAMTRMSEQLAAARQSLATSDQFASSLQASLTSLRQAQEALTADAESLAGVEQLLSAKALSAQEQTAALQASMVQMESELSAAQQAAPALEAAVTQAREALAQVTAASAALTTELAQLKERVAADSAAYDQQYSSWLALAESQGLVAGLSPLTPEQMAWSLMQATGVLQNHIDAAAQELRTATPPTAEQEADPAWRAAFEREALSKGLEKLDGSVNVFVNLFGNGAGQPQDSFFATADQSLFFANGGTLSSWIATGGQSLYLRIKGMTDAQAIADEMALTLFARHAHDEEVQWVSEYLSEASDARLQELIWAWMTSAEFRFDR